MATGTRRWDGHAAGIAAAAAALGVAELAAGIVPSGRSPTASAGDLVIRNAPGAAERWAIDVFGARDKAALVVAVVVVVLAAGAAAGGALRRGRVRTAGALVSLATVLGVLAGVRRTDGGLVDGVPPVVGALAGGAVLVWLLRPGANAPDGPLRPWAMGRRAFLLTGSATVVLGGAAAAAGRELQDRVNAEASRAAVRLPAPVRPDAPAGTDLGIDGLGPWQTPNDDFYRIDTALIVPEVEASSWSLRVTGGVERELELSFDELVSRPLVEADVTLACVSNEVGGNLVGNARWQGVPLAELLDEAGVRTGMDQVVGRSVDGFTAGMPLATVRDGRDALVAVAMNGEPLPVRHGFPARLVVGGLYGYVSATKWLREIELTRFDDFDAYWVRRGWARTGPVKVQSRIDVPRGRVDAGDAVVAGVAWATGAGVARVEVRVDGGAWHQAELAVDGGADTWRQWRWTWPARRGRHRLEVRATTAEGEVQTERRAPPFPSGATGLHRRTVDVG